MAGSWAGKWFGLWFGKWFGPTSENIIETGDVFVFGVPLRGRVKDVRSGFRNTRFDVPIRTVRRTKKWLW